MTSLSQKSINNSLTRANKIMIVNWGTPDYSSAISNISFPYTAPAAGMVKFVFNAGSDAWAKVNNISPAGRIGSKVSGNWIIQELFVNKGDIVSIGGGTVNQSECCFIPLRGYVNA